MIAISICEFSIQLRGQRMARYPLVEGCARGACAPPALIYRGMYVTPADLAATSCESLKEPILPRVTQ